MITIARRAFNSHIKSLIHFDYPYYAEANDGLNDEILGTVWARSGSASLVGQHLPADSIVSGTPAFGYRCLQTASNSDYITATTNAFAMTASGSYQFIFWVRLTATQAGNIITLLNGSTTILTIGVDTNNKLTLSLPASGFSLTSSNALPLNSWSQCAVSISGSTAKLTVNDTDTSNTISRSAIAATVCRIGGINGQIDEFSFSDQVLDTLPTSPTQAALNVLDVGGFGTGALGSVTISTDCIMNTYGCITSVSTSGSKIVVIENKVLGRFGDFASGSEVMLLMEDGSYIFRKVTSAQTYKYPTGTYLTLNDSVEAKYQGGQAILVPNMETLTIAAAATVSPASWDGKIGGVVVFRVRGNCTINGKIITSGKGRLRQDMMQLTHSKLLDNFIQNTGGAIFITCGGTFTASSSARLGATWSGAGTGGVAAYRTNGNPGGAGYGGGGSAGYYAGTDSDSNYYSSLSKGGSGGVGGGGGSGLGGVAGDAGVSRIQGTKSTGGSGTGSNAFHVAGGTQGVTPGGNAEDNQALGAQGGGGGAGGGHVNYRGSMRGYSGANLVLIVNRLRADAAAISTGGDGGEFFGYEITPAGGGGTGFCYIAAKTLG